MYLYSHASTLLVAIDPYYLCRVHYTTVVYSLDTVCYLKRPGTVM